LEPDPVLPEPVLEPMPLEPLPVLPAPDGLLLGDALEPLEDDAPCSFTQRSFSGPVRLAHWAGVAVEPLVALGELLDEPLVEDPVLPLALGVLPAPCDDESAAKAAVDIANRAASVAVESTLNIVALLYEG